MTRELQLMVGVCSILIGIGVVVSALTKTPLIVIGECQGGGCTVGKYDEHHPPMTEWDYKWRSENMR